ncbi:MMPL family transporter [Amycolatopsis anabasis]|uniref:MMPL family transporter n=1 Tax=Amycolatopsis anabasis TaxID=1840409 RepID=UPI00131C222D|nr:MMPL family transporter [Amycolatopsis anabasis]
MFTSLGRFAVGHARGILAGTLLVLVAAGALGFTAFGKLKSQGFSDPAAESSQAADLVNARFGGAADLVFLVAAHEGTVDGPAVSSAGTQLTDRLAADPDLAGVTSYWRTAVPPLRSDDGRYALVVARLTGGETGLERVAERYGGDRGPISVTVGGGAAAGRDIGGQVGADLALAESIAVPVVLVLLVLAFGSAVAALLPLAVGGIAILGTFAELAILGSVTDVSVFAINLTTALGLALGIDYALLMVSRFREELAAGAPTRDAVVRTVETAGRTILFSAATVAVALSALLLFPMYFLRSFAYAGIGVIIIAVAGALLALPALLVVLGSRVNAGRLPWARRRSPGTFSPFWGKLAATALRRPVLTAAPVIVLLLIAAAPLLRVEFGSPDDRVLPESAPTRVVGDTLRAHFPADNSRAIEVVTTGGAAWSEVDGYARRLSRLPGVAAVNSSAGTYANGQFIGASPADAALARPDAQRLNVITRAEARSAAAQDVVTAVRATAPPDGTGTLVGGGAAQLLDSKDTIGERLPFAAALIALTTFVLLFLFTGGVFQPLRALLFNVLSLSATLGVMVLIFQDGGLSSVLGFTPMPLDMSMLVLLFCIAFGLSMDYEVFVLSRIKETRELGANTRDAVVHGLSHTGRIVSAAAALMAVSVFAFATSGVSFIQLFGLGTGLAILIDATLIRGILVPAGMRLLGDRAWWAPGPLRRLHDRFGLSETDPPRPEAERVPV